MGGLIPVSFFLVQMRISATNAAKVTKSDRSCCSIWIRLQKALWLPWLVAQHQYGVTGSWWTLFGMGFNFKQAPEKKLCIFSFEGANLPGFGTQMNLQVFWAKVGCELVTFSGGKGNVKGKNPVTHMLNEPVKCRQWKSWKMDMEESILRW